MIPTQVREIAEGSRIQPPTGDTIMGSQGRVDGRMQRITADERRGETRRQESLGGCTADSGPLKNSEIELTS
ncbi:MAG TPA: hypothetical protein VNO20_01120 [Solirubrobacterales bacterium]|nr:hypothetical protein [Solirubrobacterales bacterium]